MGISNKIKGLLMLSGKKVSDLARYLDKEPQIISNKLYRSRFTARELAKIAGFLGATLTITLPDGQSCTIYESDFPEKEDEAK